MAERSDMQEIVGILRKSTLTRHEMAIWQGRRGESDSSRHWSSSKSILSRALWAPLILLFLFRRFSNQAYIQQSEYIQLIHAIICASFIRHTTIIGITLTRITSMTIANIDCKEALREFDTMQQVNSKSSCL